MKLNSLKLSLDLQNLSIWHDSSVYITKAHILGKYLTKAIQRSLGVTCQDS